MGAFSILALYLLVLSGASCYLSGSVAIERFAYICTVWTIPVLATSVFSSVIAKGMKCHSSSIVLIGMVLGCYVTLAYEPIFQSAIESIEIACTSTLPMAVPVVMGSALFIGGLIGSCIVLSVGAVDVIVALFSVTKPKIDLIPLRIPLLAFITGSVLEAFVKALIPLFPK
jgi:hypothetical protein